MRKYIALSMALVLMFSFIPFAARGMAAEPNGSEGSILSKGTNGTNDTNGMLLNEPEEPEEGYPVKVDANKWAIVRAASAPPIVDGKLDESFWQQAAGLGDFRTTYYNKPVTDSPEYRISYDDTSLYIGGEFQQQEGETLSSIEIILRKPASPQAYYVASIPVDPTSRLAWLNWKAGETAGGQSLQEIKLSPFPFVLKENETNSTVGIEAAIPLSSFSISEGIAPGEEWGVNIVHVHNLNTQPMIAWAPIRTSMYDDTALEPGGPVNLQTNVPDQSRFGSIFFESFPEGEPWLPSEWELDDIGFTEKQLTFKREVTSPPVQLQYRLSWIDPKGHEQELLQFSQVNDGDYSTITFEHPAALIEGQYQLRVLTYENVPGDGQLAIYSFDRHSLIEAGNAKYAAGSSGSGTALTPVTPAPPSLEVQEIMDLIPEQSGFAEVGLPEKPSLTPTFSLYALSADGQSLVAADTGTVYPNALYPETQHLTVTNRKGEAMDYPYYEDAQGKKYFLSARLWYEQRERAVARTNAVASADPLGAARLLYQFVQAFDGYVPITNRGQNSYPASPSSGPPYNMFSGNWNIWNINDLRSMKPLLLAYEKVKQTDAFEVLSLETGVDVEKEIVEGMFIPSIDFVLSLPVFNYNVDPYIWEGLIAAGKTLDRPDYIHLAVEWMNHFVRTSFLADGFWKEVSLSYHNQVAYFIGVVMSELQGYSDPPGYISPRTGKRFDNLDLQSEFAILDRMDKISSILAYPNGKALPIQDTWAELAGNPLPDAGSVLLPSTGIGRLTLGEGAEQSQLYMMFTPKNGHHHYDPLNLTLFAEGQELMPDLGYTYTNYAQFTLSTIAHNTVVVDGKNMQFDSATKDGGRIERFVPDADMFQVMRASDPEAYPETSEYSREPWFIPFADGEADGPGDGGKGYVLDLFRVSGGDRHEYTLQGDANRNALFRTDLLLDTYGPYLLPPGTEVQQPKNYYDFGSAEGQYPGYIYVRDVQQAELEGDQYKVTLTTLDDSGKEQAKLGITGLLESGDNELYLGRSPSLRSTRLYGAGSAYDNNEEAEKYDMPKLVLRRSGTDLKSTFVTAMEPYRGTEGPRIEVMERLTPDQAPEGAVAVKVTYGATTDIILSNPGHPGQPVVIGDITLLGELGMIRLTNGVVEKMELIGGTLLKKGSQELTGADLLTGTVRKTLRQDNGQAADALVTDTPVPDTAIGRYIIVTHPDGSTSGFKIGDVREEQGQTILELAEQDPGFEIYQDGSSQQVYYPAKHWNGLHTFTIADMEAQAGVEQAALPTGSVTGTVYGPDSLPLPGATVNLAGYASITVTTDNEGQFQLSQVPQGSHRVLAAKPELSRKESGIVQVTAGETGIVSIALTDRTAPKWTEVVSETTIGDAVAFGIGDPIQATISEDGVVYLVPAGTMPTLPKLEAAVITVGGVVQGVKASGLAGVPIVLDTSGVASGSYVLYAIDSYGNNSDGFPVVSIPDDLTFIDNTNTSIEYSGAWTTLGNGSEGSGSVYYGDSQAFTKQPGAYADITFYGIEAQMISSKNISRGKAIIYVDGEYKETIDLYSLEPKFQQVIFETGVLPKGVHKIRIEAAADINPASQQNWAWVVFDALRVLREEQPPLELSGVTSGPLVSGEPVSARSSRQGILYLVPASTELTKEAIQTAASSSGSSVSVTAQVYGHLSTAGLTTGIYKVYAIDGSGNISAGSIDLTIVNSQDMMIDSANPVVRYSGAWNIVPDGGEGAGAIYYGGSQAHTKAQGAYAYIPFYGTAAQVIASSSYSRGKAKVYVDGEYKETIDLYSAETQFQKVVYDTGTLAEGMHVVRIEAAREVNANADPDWPWVVFDALQITPALPPVLSDVTSGPLVSGNSVSAVSSKQGTLYLVPSSTELTKVAIETAARISGTSAAVTANVYGHMSTAALTTGVYKVYAIDKAGNISIGSMDIEVFAPAAKIDNTNAVVKYSGTWNIVPNGGEGAGSIYYGGSQAHTKQQGAYVDIPFYGAAAQVIASMNFSRGKAKVYVDGEYKATLDLYSAEPELQKVVYDTGVLSEGMHVVRIEAAGEFNANADPDWPWVVFDALQVQSGEQVPPVVVGSSPINGAVDVSLNQVISVQFNHSIAEGTSYAGINLIKHSISEVSEEEPAEASVEASLEVPVEVAVVIEGSGLKITPVDSLDPGSTYTLTIPATAIKDQHAHELGEPYSLSFTTMEVPVDTTSPTWAEGSALTASDAAQTSIKLNWPAALDNVGIDGYRVYVDESVVATVYTNYNNYTVTGLAANTSYSFMVKAFDEAGNESSGLSRTAATLSYPPSNNQAYAERSGNANLEKLQVLLKGTALTLSPAFASNQLAYTVKTEAEQVEISVQTAHSASKVIINGQPVGSGFTVDLQEGKNEFKLVVTAENGTKQTYTLDILRTVSESKAEKPEGTGKSDNPKVSFTDIVGHWAESAIQEAVKRGLIQGYEDGTFHPEGEVTRAEFITLLVRALALPIMPVSADDIPFIDVASTKWYAGEVLAAYKAKIIQGVDERRFAPNEKISREQMAVLLARAYAFVSDRSVTEENQLSKGYRDGSSISPWALTEVNQVLQLGLMQGKGNGIFEPHSNASRAEAVQVMLNLLKIEQL
ncbi:S-layer homology domain-containing protein [Paenibacillus eucommiae]|uniref:Uncharacterized protein n=1 Tax=Paenibacillus eucommiae TaxID=1355755 RepID=A0ABS4J1W8_9BACL|nr:S-layer homology domain-containing protein [Paenibacillus eucommiae]MBP1993778.1 hypothetical protein [Paenibacillus eucommiae]